MSELPGTSAVGIETVEWAAESGGNLTVRITGRWRRRRPVNTGQPTLVIEADGRRHRYPAMPEPPSLAGTPPGLWRLSFTVPGWLAPDLGRTWLQLGTVIVPLPVAVPAPGERPIQLAPIAAASAAPAPPVAPGPEGQAAGGPRIPGTSQAAPGPHAGPPPGGGDPGRSSTPRGRAPGESPGVIADLAERVQALERDLRAAQAGRDELAASLAERDRGRRAAEQQAHAEQALRLDLARQLSTSVREAERVRQAMGDLAAAEERIRGLEEELRQARRRSDEAEQVAAAASAARERAEHERERVERERERIEQERERVQREMAGAPIPAAGAETARVRFEHELRGRRAGEAVWIPAEPVAAALRGIAASAAAREPEPEVPQPESVPPPPEPVVPQPESVPPPPEPEVPQPESVLPPPPEPPAPSPPPVSMDPLELGALRRELDSRARADAAVRSRLIDAEARLAARVLLERRTTATLTEFRGELDTLRGALAHERSLRAEAEQRAVELERELSGQRALSRGAYDAIGELRGALEGLTRPAPEAEAAPGVEPEPPSAAAEPEPGPPAGVARPAPSSETPGPSALEPARLNDALSRLRETIAPQAQAAGEPAAVGAPSLLEALRRPSLEPSFRRLLRTDAEAAGRLLLELLPLQPIAYPHAMAYDLVLGTGRGCVCVTVPDKTVTIGVQSAPRPREEVDFQVFGEPARIARLLTAGRLRRRLGLGVARMRGRREGLSALSALLGTPLDLRALHGAGVRLDPATAFALVSSMVDPAWTARERFTLAHAEPETATTYVIVRDGRPIEVTRTAPDGRIATTLRCTADELLLALSGGPAPGLTIDGDEGPLASLRQWIARAQSE